MVKEKMKELKLSYSKGCFSETITIDDSNMMYILSNGHRSEENDERIVHFNELQTLILDILPVLSEQNIKILHMRFIYEKYELNAENTCHEVEMRQDLNDFINNFTKENEDLFAIFDSLIEILPSSIDDNYHNCDQCGDTNYSRETLLIL